MKLALSLVLLVACGGSSTPAPRSPETETTAVEAPASAASPTKSPSTPASPPASAPASTTVAAPVTTKTAGATAKRAPYSCFTYSQRNSTAQRTACMRTEECGPYLDQAKQVGGIVEVTGCASVEALWCFHEAPTKTDPQGADVCQPSMDACRSERALLVRSGTSVDTECGAR